MQVANEMSVFHLFPSNVMGDCIGIVFESQEKIGQLSNWATDGLKGVYKFGLVTGRFMRARRDSEMLLVGSS